MQPADEYAGDVTPTEAFQAITDHPDAMIVDVRTVAEWNFVGLPDLGRSIVTVEWSTFPDGERNEHFLAQLAAAGVDPNAPVYFLCRSGARSASAAALAAGAGYAQAYNITGGFEGTHDSQGHRGSTSGWKAEGLPWRQG